MLRCMLLSMWTRALSSAASAAAISDSSIAFRRLSASFLNDRSSRLACFRQFTASSNDAAVGLGSQSSSCAILFRTDSLFVPTSMSLFVIAQYLTALLA